jgi:N-carbamoyl-L-amino-acid hydrolase
MDLPVDSKRLWQTHMDMAEIGALPKGGSCRTSLSPEDKAGRELFVAWCRDAGCDVSWDAAGNIYARRPGRSPEAPAVATGSHLDTQPHGGRFDGIYGVLAGLEVVRSLNDRGIETEKPLDVVVWTNEEGVRFGPPLTGSSAFAKKVTIEEVHSTKTVDGTTVKDDLLATGFLGDELPGSRQFDSFFEAHIEQGPVLESEGKQIGVVTDIVGIRWVEVKLAGQDAHAGTTPMTYRRDALNGAARVMVALDDFVRSLDPLARLTVGKLGVEPNSGATIPGMATFNCDLRHPDAAVLDEMETRIRSEVDAVCKQFCLEGEVSVILNKAPLPFDDEIVATVRDAADALGLSRRDILSGAGHDAMNLADRIPTGMIFVPCKDGISHNEAEYAAPDDLAAGAAVLLRAMVSRAGRGN